MPDIKERLGSEVLVIDGAMGTMLQRAGVAPGRCHEELNVTSPEIVLDVHRGYVDAGADCITTNTFGGTRPKLDAYGLGDRVAEFNRAAVRIARQAGAAYVLADVGPTGLVMEPLGAATFDEVHAHFTEQVETLAAEGPDAILIETMTDIAEARCALLAARDVCDLPVFASVSFGTSGRMELSGTTPEAAAVVLDACGASAIGVNCGLGPEQTLPIVEELASSTSLPVFVQPNAGMPRLEDGETMFPGTAEEMGQYAARFVGAGTVLVGSCCGSTPAFTAAIVESIERRPMVGGRDEPAGLALASAQTVVRLGAERSLVVIGECINPTGKEQLAGALREGALSTVRDIAVDQQHDGADILDVNVGAPGIDEKTVLSRVVKALVALTDLPLVLDNTDPVALEAALKAYPGRALINSVSGCEESMRTILPLAKYYGAAVLILALDDDGIPADVDGRLAVAQHVRTVAHQVGLSDRDLAVDCLVMTAATDPDAAAVTLEAVRTVTESWGLPTVLGVSNVSHGLPGRPHLNATFLSMAVEAGLSAAIMNPSDLGMSRTAVATDLLMNKDPNAERWIAFATALEDGEDDPVTAGDTTASLMRAIEKGDEDAAPGMVDELIESGLAPNDVIATALTPAIQALGEGFGRGEVFLPQLMAAADAMKAAIVRAKSYLPDSEDVSAGRVVFGTVKGDIHSIGKDICVSLLESAGFDVDDLGVDVETERFIEAAEGATAVCLSALMTTTLPAMERTARALTDAGAVAVVGGAVVTEMFASGIGALHADDAPGCVARVHEIAAGTEVVT